MDKHIPGNIYIYVCHILTVDLSDDKYFAINSRVNNF